MECYCELDNAQSRTKVPPRLTHRVQHELTDFVGEVHQILLGHGSQRSEIGLNVFQQWCYGFVLRKRLDHRSIIPYSSSKSISGLCLLQPQRLSQIRKDRLVRVSRGGFAIGPVEISVWCTLVIN